MKLRFIISALLMMLATAVSAQSANLKVSQILDGKVVPLERMVVTKVKDGHSASTGSTTTAVRDSSPTARNAPSVSKPWIKT